MPSSTQLQKYWRSVSDPELAVILGEATLSVAAFAEATAASGSLLQTWIRGQELVERFAMGSIEGHEHSCLWLTGFVPPAAGG